MHAPSTNNKSWLPVQFFILFFLGPHLQHMEVPKPVVETELQLLAYVTSTAMTDLCHVFDLHHSSWQCGILYPLSETRDQTCILMDTSQIHFCWAIDRNSCFFIFNFFFNFLIRLQNEKEVPVQVVTGTSVIPRRVFICMHEWGCWLLQGLRWEGL